MTQFDEFLTKVLADPVAKTAFDDAGQRNLLIDHLVRRRTRLGLSKAEMARRMGFKSSQPITTFEAEGSDPQFSTIQQYARAVGMRVTVGMRAENDPEA